MPVVQFNTLPDGARVWVFASSDPVRGEAAARLLEAVDAWLAEWRAHGTPLTCARDWRDHHFLAVGVDQSQAGASGCSIDALFRVLQQIQDELGTSLVGGGRVFYREADGTVGVAGREEFAQRLATGTLDDGTRVFDTTLTDARAWRRDFERRLADSWHRGLAAARWPG